MAGEEKGGAHKELVVLPQSLVVQTHPCQGGRNFEGWPCKILSASGLVSGKGGLFFASLSMPLWGSSWERCVVVVGSIDGEGGESGRSPPNTLTRLVENIWFP